MKGILGKQGSMLRNGASLVSGTAVAQILALLALPVLTRIYSPEDFEVLAAYVALVTTFSVIACLRYDIAVLLPENDEDALGLAVIATSSGIVFPFIIYVALTSLFDPSRYLPLGLIDYLWLVPLGVSAAGAFSAAQFWATRMKRYSSIAYTRVMQSFCGLSVQLGGGLLLNNAVWLLLGYAIMGGAGAARLLRMVWRDGRANFRSLSVRRIVTLAREYRRYPLFSTWEALANNAALQVPVLIIAAVAVGPEAGFVMLTSKVLGAPIALLGGAMAQLYMAEARTQDKARSLDAFTERFILRLSFLFIPPLMIGAVIAPLVFELVFGADWRRAGELVLWMVPWFVLKAISFPISTVMHVKNAIHQLLWLMLFGLLLRVGFTCMADPRLAAEAYAVSGGLFYLLALLVYANYAGIKSVVVARSLLIIICLSAVSLSVGQVMNIIFEEYWS